MSTSIGERRAWRSAITASLTLTSYAVLSLLWIRPWTSYGLAREMARSVGFVCPRASSHVYAEPKRLVKLGLAAATRERTGRRARTRYSITRNGKDALRAWLASSPIADPWLESEALLRIFFAQPGSIAQTTAALDSLANYARGVEAIGTQVAEAYLANPARFGDRGPFAALISTFLVGHSAFMRGWAERSREAVARWHDFSRKGKEAWVEAAFRDVLATRGAARVAARRWRRVSGERGKP